MERLRCVRKHTILLALFALVSALLFASTAFAQAQKYHSLDTTMAACIKCHPRAKPTHMSQKPGDMRADLPLDSQGRMLCTTCHECIAGKCRLRSEDKGLCLVCHDCTQGMACLVGTAHLGDSADITQMSSEKCMTCHRHGEAPELCMLGNRTVKAELDLGGKEGRVVLMEGKVTCVSCHNPYSTQYAKLAAPQKGRNLCTACHESVEGFDHSRYEAVRECVACHPRTLPTHTRQKPVKMNADLPLDEFGKMKCTTCHDCKRDKCLTRKEGGKLCQACHDCTSGMACYIGTPHLGDASYFGSKGANTCLGCHDGIVGQEICPYGRRTLDGESRAACISCHSIYSAAHNKITSKPTDGTYCPRVLRDYDSRACTRCHH